LVGYRNLTSLEFYNASSYVKDLLLLEYFHDNMQQNIMNRYITDGTNFLTLKIILIHYTCLDMLGMTVV
jgi:hypothetical protein